MVPAPNSRVLLKLANEAPQPASDLTTDRTGNELAGWEDGMSLVTIFPAGEARDEIAAMSHEPEQPPPRATEEVQVRRTEETVSRMTSGLICLWAAESLRIHGTIC